MIIQFKYLSTYVQLVIMCTGTNSGHVISNNITEINSVRVRRQAGYVYDKPSVSFDLPTATSIATTQAPTVDRTQMQMYYAYPVPAAGAGDTVNIGQQNTVSSAGSTATVSSTANGYSYGVQNTQAVDSPSSTLVETQNTAYTGYQNTAVTGTQAVVSSDSNSGYQDTTVRGSQVAVSSGPNSGYQSTAVKGTQTVISSGSTGYGDGRPSVPTSVSTSGSVSTSAPRYLPPQNSGEGTVGISVTTSNQAQNGVTITQQSQSYIPPSAQVSSPQNEQAVTITQSAANTPLPPNTGYLLPNPQPVPKVSVQPGPVQPVNVPTQQYLPPIEAPTGQKTIEGPVAAPASTYLPPVF